MFYCIKCFIPIGIVLCAAFILTFVIVWSFSWLKIVLHHLAIIYTMLLTTMKYIFIQCLILWYNNYLWPVHQCGTIQSLNDTGFTGTCLFFPPMFPVPVLSKNLLESLTTRRECDHCNQELVMRFLIWHLCVILQFFVHEALDMGEELVSRF